MLSDLSCPEFRSVWTPDRTPAPSVPVGGLEASKPRRRRCQSAIRAVAYALHQDLIDELRRSAYETRTRSQVRDQVDGYGDDPGPEAIRQQRVPERHLAHSRVRGLGLGDREGHADREREVGEIAVGRRLALLEVDPAVDVHVVQARVLQREDGVD